MTVLVLGARTKNRSAKTILKVSSVFLDSVNGHWGVFVYRLTNIGVTRLSRAIGQDFNVGPQEWPADRLHLKINNLYAAPHYIYL